MGKTIFLTDKQITEAIGEYVIKHKLLTNSFSISLDHDVYKPIFGQTQVKLNGAILKED